MLYGKRSEAARVDSVVAESAAAAAGFQAGDLVLSINGRPVASFTEMQRIVSTSAGETLTIVVDRGGTQMTLIAVPALKEVKDSFGNVHRIGVLGISRSCILSRTHLVWPLTLIQSQAPPCSVPE
jgi:regulator of sigma E protease